MHNDVNKILWTALAWDRKAHERNILKEYSYFFGSAFAEEAADGILALEKNWPPAGGLGADIGMLKTGSACRIAGTSDRSSEGVCRIPGLTTASMNGV